MAYWHDCVALGWVEGAVSEWRQQVMRKKKDLVTPCRQEYGTHPLGSAAELPLRALAAIGKDKIEALSVRSGLSTKVGPRALASCHVRGPREKGGEDTETEG